MHVCSCTGVRGLLWWWCLIFCRRSNQQLHRNTQGVYRCAFVCKQQQQTSHHSIYTIMHILCVCCDCLPLHTTHRPTKLLQYLHDARQQLLRAAVLVYDTRKLPPLVQLVQPGGVLDIAANHARALQTTADELFRANGLLAFQRVPLFNVPDALDVLSTGA